MGQMTQLSADFRCCILSFEIPMYCGIEPRMPLGLTGLSRM